MGSFCTINNYVDEKNCKTEQLNNFSLSDNKNKTIIALLQENNNNNELKNMSDDVEEFTLNGYQTIAKIVYVYDGDTVHSVFKLNNKMVKFNCRLNGIDSPEMIPKNIEDKHLRELEMFSAIKSRNYLIEKVTDQKIEDKLTKAEIKELCKKSNKLVFIKCYNFDKYGRLLIDIFDENNNSINQQMINDKQAVSYNGGTKIPFEYNIIS